MRLTVFVDKAPDGFEKFKCAQPACRKLARGMVNLNHLPRSVRRRTRAYCTAHTGERITEHGDERIDQTIAGHLVRRRLDAPGGWYGWEYGIVIPPAEAAERDDCESWPELARAFTRSQER